MRAKNTKFPVYSIFFLFYAGDASNVPGAVSSTRFLDVVLEAAAQSDGLGGVFDPNDVPQNLTAVITELLEFSRSLDTGGSIWRTLDALGAISSTVYK